MVDDRKVDETPPGKKPEAPHQYNIGGMAGKKIDPETQPQPSTGGADEGGANKKSD